MAPIFRSAGTCCASTPMAHSRRSRRSGSKVATPSPSRNDEVGRPAWLSRPPLHRMRADFSQFVAQVSCRERVRRWPVAVRAKRRRHNCSIDGIQQFTRTLEILGFDLVEHLHQHVSLVRRRRTLPGVDTIYGRVEAPINALDKEIIFHGLTQSCFPLQCRSPSTLKARIAGPGPALEPLPGGAATRRFEATHSTHRGGYGRKVFFARTCRLLSLR